MSNRIRRRTSAYVPGLQIAISEDSNIDGPTAAFFAHMEIVFDVIELVAAQTPSGDPIADLEGSTKCLQQLTAAMKLATGLLDLPLAGNSKREQKLCKTLRLDASQQTRHMYERALVFFRRARNRISADRWPTVLPPLTPPSNPEPR